MNKGERNVRCFSQFENSYGKVRAELGFFQASCLIVSVIVSINAICKGTEIKKLS